MLYISLKHIKKNIYIYEEELKQNGFCTLLLSGMLTLEKC